MYKVALITITLNEKYWQYLPQMTESAKKFFLKDHQVDYFSWSDMPQDKIEGVKIIPTEPYEWPLPTLMRYHVFLREEELLKEYDYIFYIDSDMDIVSPVGDEILGDLVGAEHPMHHRRREYNSPFESNPESSAFIPQSGRILGQGKNKYFEPNYFAGGFQGGRSDVFIKAMKKMKEMIDVDFSKNYIARWNDESYWNRYCFDNPPTVVLSPSYVYPDSLNKAYYQQIWGRQFIPKIITITKPFTLSKTGGNYLKERLNT